LPSTNLNYTKLADRNVSFGLIRTNPKLTSNVKLTVDSTGEMWFNSIDATEQLADQKYKLFPINPKSNHETNIFRFYDNGKTPSKISFAVGSSVRTDVLARDLKDQYDFDLYSSGAKYLSADYSEKFSYLAPLYLDKVIPEYFVIFKIPGASNYSTDEWYRKTNDPDFSQTNFAEDLFKNAIIIKSISLKEDSNLGTYLRNIRRNPMYPNYPLYVNFKEDRFSLYRGISINSGTYVEIPELLDSTLRRGLPQLALEKYITGGFERNNVVHPRILNLEFLFDDDTSTDYSINRYIGFYCNAIDLARFDLDLVKMYENDADNDNPVQSVYTKYDDISVTLTNPRGVVLRGEGVTTDLSFINQSLSNADNLMFPYIRSKGDNLHFIRVNKDDPAAQTFSQISSNITFAVDDTSFDIGRLFGPDTLFSQELAQEIVQDTRTTILLQLQDEPAHLDTIRLYHQNGSTFEDNDPHQKYDDIVFVGGLFENGEEYSLEYPIVDQILFDTESPDDFFQTTSSSEHTFGNDTCILECADVTGFAEGNTVFVRAIGGGYLIGTINTIVDTTLTIDVSEESGSDSSSSWAINRSAQFTPNIQVVSNSGIGSLIPSLGSISVPCNSVDIFEVGNMVKIYQPVNRSYRMAGRITEIDTEALTITVMVDYEYGGLADSIWIVQRLDIGIQYRSEANGTLWKSNGRDFEQGAVGSRIYVNLDNAEKDSLDQTAITIDNTTISDSAVYTLSNIGDDPSIVDAIGLKLGKIVKIQNSSGGYVKGIVTSIDDEQFTVQSRIANAESDFASGFEVLWTVSDTNKLTTSLTKLIGNLYSTHLVSSTYHESLFIQSRPYGNTYGSLGLRNISESQSFLINGKYTTSTVLADSGLIKPQIIIPVGNIERLSQSLDSLVVKTYANWSSIDRVCNSATYVNNGNGETTSQTVADYLKYATLMIHDEEKVLIDYDKIEIRNIFKPSIGFLSLFEIKDIDFDTYTSRYAKIPEIDLYQYYYIPENTSILDFTQYSYQLVGDGSISINEIEYIATGSDPVLIWQDREGLHKFSIISGNPVVTLTDTLPGRQISQVENITPTTRLDIGILDEDSNLQNFTGFFGLGASHTAPNQNSITYGYRDKYLSNGLSSEYHVYLENFSKDFSTDGRVVPYIAKWGIADSTDARGNAYRLNCDIAFGKDNFGPSHRETAPTAEKLTHEWFYVESNFNYLLDQELVRKNLYYFDSPLDINRLISEPAYFEDYFTYVPKFNGSEIDRPQFRYSKLIRNQFTNQYETIFNGAKFIFSEKNASGEILPTTTRFNDYNFSILLKPVKESLTNPQNPIEYRIIENTDSKSILILIEVALSGIDKIAKNLLIGSYNPLSEFSSGRLDQANLFTSGYSVNKDLITIPVDVVYTTNADTEGDTAFDILYADETVNIDQLESFGTAINQFTGETISPFNLLDWENILVKKGSATSSQLLISTPSGSLFELANTGTLSDFCISGLSEYLTNGTSTDSLNPSSLDIDDVLTIQTQAGLAYVEGQLIQLYNSPDSYINGMVAGYNYGTGDLTFIVTAKTGSSVASPWTISLAGGTYPYRLSRSKRVVSNTRAYKTVRLLSDDPSQIYPILLDERGNVPVQRVDTNWLSTSGDYRIRFNSEQVSNLTYAFMYSVKDKKYNALKSSFSTVKLATGVSFSPPDSNPTGPIYSLIARKLRGLPDFIYGLDSFINPTSGATDLRPAFAPIMMINRAGEIAILLDTRVDLKYADNSDKSIGLANPLLTGHAITSVSENSVTVSRYVDRNRGLPGIRYVSLDPASYSAADMLAARIDLIGPTYIGETVTILFQSILQTPTISDKYKVNDIIRIENIVSNSATGNYLMAKITEVIQASYIIKATVYYQSGNTQSGNQWSDLTSNSLQVVKPELSIAATSLNLNLSANQYPRRFTSNDLWTDGYQQFQLFGGKNYFLNLFENLSFANFLKTIRNGSAILSWETYTNGIKLEGQQISIDVEEADIIEKSQIVSISEEFVEAGNRSQVGGYSTAEQLTEKYELFRYSGEYEVLFKSIAGFKYRNQLGEFVLDGSNVRLNPNVANFFVMPEFSYVKYSNRNILDLEQSPKFSARYPLIGESPIDYTAFNSLASSWDFGYHYQYSGKSTKTAIAGTNRITEDYSFVSKLINLPLDIIVEPTTFQQITNEEFEVTDQEFTNLGIDFAYSIYATDIKLKINLGSLIAKKIISAGLGESFNQFFKAENGSTLQVDAAILGNQTLDEYKLNYCLVNLVKLYTLDALQCYARPDHTLIDNSASFTQLTYNEIELQGYSQLNTIQINNPKSTILTCSVPKLASTGVSLVPKLKIKYI